MRTAHLALLALLAGCADREVPIQLPDLPPGLDAAEAVIRRDLESRHARAIAAVEEDRSAAADRVGDVGISLLAHGYYNHAAATLEWARRLAGDAFDWHYYYGHAARRTGDMEAAARGFAAALEAAPASLPARLWWAECRLHREHLDEAEQAFGRALEQDPHCAQAMTGLGRVALSRNDYDEAESRLRQSLEHLPDSPPARYALALTLRALGRVDDARNQLDRLEGENHSLTITCFEDPWMQEVRRRQIGTRGHEERALQARADGLAATALVELRAAVAANPNRYPARYDIALLLLRQERREEARAEIEALLGLHPDYAAALALSAVLAAEVGAADLAQRRIRRAIELDPEDEALHTTQAEMALRGQRLAEALAAYDRALALSPAHTPARVGRARTLVELGRTEEALQELASLRATYPSRPELPLAAALAILSHPEGDAEAALGLAASAPPVLATAGVTAAALARTGRFAEAIEQQQRLVKSLAAHPGAAPIERRAAALLQDYERHVASDDAVDWTLLASELLLHTPIAPIAEDLP